MSDNIREYKHTDAPSKITGEASSVRLPWLISFHCVLASMFKLEISVTDNKGVNRVVIPGPFAT